MWRSRRGGRATWGRSARRRWRRGCWTARGRPSWCTTGKGTSLGRFTRRRGPRLRSGRWRRDGANVASRRTGTLRMRSVYGAYADVMPPTLHPLPFRKMTVTRNVLQGHFPGKVGAGRRIRRRGRRTEILAAQRRNAGSIRSVYGLAKSVMPLFLFLFLPQKTVKKKKTKDMPLPGRFSAGPPRDLRKVRRRSRPHRRGRGTEATMPLRRSGGSIPARWPRPRRWRRGDGPCPGSMGPRRLRMCSWERQNAMPGHAAGRTGSS